MSGENEFILEFDGDPADVDEAATDVVAWFDDDDELRGASEPRMKPAAPGEMGGLADAARIATAAAAPLGKALATWLTARVRNKGQVKMSVIHDGRAFAVEASSVAEIEALMPHLREFFAA